MKLINNIKLSVVFLMLNFSIIQSQNDGEMLYNQYKKYENIYLTKLKEELANQKIKNDYKINFDSCKIIIHPEYVLNNHFFDSIDSTSWLHEGDYDFEAFVFVGDTLRYVVYFNKQFGHGITYLYQKKADLRTKDLYKEMNYLVNLDFKLVFKIKGFYYGEVFYVKDNKIMMKWPWEPTEDIEAKIGIRKYYTEDFIYDLIKKYFLKVE